METIEPRRRPWIRALTLGAFVVAMLLIGYQLSGRSTAAAASSTDAPAWLLDR